MAVPKKGLKGVKSSKTAHVLNLLTAPESGEKEREASADASRVQTQTQVPVPALGSVLGGGAADSAPAEPEGAPVAALSSRPLTPPTLEIASTNDDQIAAQIRAALEEELEIELKSSGITLPESEPEPEPEPKPEPEPAPKPKPKPEPVPELSDDEFIALNIVEKLVDELAPRYIKMFGLCTCSHCAADVRALTLSRLQPQYIGVSRKRAGAMVTIYESRLSGTIIAQLTQSCQTVMSSPRHDK